MTSLPDYEALGSFYLGRAVNDAGEALPEPLLYDSRDLTTHAVCVGMTGSGKTGLCISLLEEAAIDGIPAIVIDPKGDMGNLLLTFPALRGEDFAPWVDQAAAQRKGQSVPAFAEDTARTWRDGLAQWNQDGARIQRLHDAADIVVYTPGSETGRPLSVLKSFDAPEAHLLADTGALRERISATVSGLLGLAGIDADPLQSREHILLATLFEQAWTQGRDLGLEGLLQGIQKPGFDKVGVFDLETFYPARERLQLAMRLNNLIASPGFSAWMQGEPLNIQSLLYTATGKPRVAVISIAHLNDAERMFMVTLLLGEMVAWMRRQSGTSSLRALLYMDEIFGYFPPSAMPPSKLPLLTLMKQARAFGVGVVLATQNPVDLDYKGLSNAGTWFIGRLQTERDQARLIDGLLNANGAGLDRPRLEALLANLGNRTFLMRNVHDDAPVLFRTRWAMSYLRGPMTLQELAKLSPPPSATGKSAPAPQAAADTAGAKPVIPAGIEELHLRADRPGPATLVPRVVGMARLHFVDKRAGLDAWETRTLLAPLDDALADADWPQADVHADLEGKLSSTPPEQAHYTDAPAALLREANYRSWGKTLKAHLYETATLEVFHCPVVAQSVAPGSTEAEFRGQLALALREKRDEEIEKLRKKYATRLRTLQDQIRRAEERVERERADLSQKKMDSFISIGTSLLGALMGRKVVSATNARRVGTAARSAGRISKESSDVARAEENHEVLQQRLTDLQAQIEADIARLRSELDPASVEIEQRQIKPRKTDIEVRSLALAWVPVN